MAFWDDWLHQVHQGLSTANQKADAYFAPKSDNGHVEVRARDFMRELPGATVKVASGIAHEAQNIGQGTARGIVGLGKSLAETSDGRQDNLKQLMSIPEDERKKLADQGDDPNNTDSKAIFASLARKKLGGDISDKALKSRMDQIDKEKSTDEHVTNPIARFFLGSEKDEGIQTVQKRNKDIQASLQDKGVDEKTASGLAVVGAGGVSALDVPSGGGGIVKAIGKDGLEQLAKAGSEDAVKNVLKSRFPTMAEDAVKTVAGKIAQTADHGEIKNILKGVGTKAEGLLQHPKDLIAGVKDSVTHLTGAPTDIKTAATTTEDALPTTPVPRVIDEMQPGVKTADTPPTGGITVPGRPATDPLPTPNPVNDAALSRETASATNGVQTGDIPHTNDPLADTNAASGVPSAPPTPPVNPNEAPKYGDAADKLLSNLRYGSQIKKEAEGNVFQRVATQTKEQLVDKLSPINDFVKTIESHVGKKLTTEQNPYERMRLFNGMSDRVQQRVTGMTDILKQAPDLNAVKVVGMARQIIDRAGRGIDSTMTADEARQAIEEVRSKLGTDKFDQVAKTVDAVNEYNHGLLTDLKDSGLISPDSYRAIMDTNAHYFSKFNVVDHILKNDQNRALFASGGSYNATKQSLNKVIREATGHGNDTKLLDPIEAMVRATDQTMRVVEKNNIWNTWYDLSKEAPDLVKVVRDPSDVAERIGLGLENKEMRPIRDKTARLIQTRARWVRGLESQINQLEKKGLNLSLKKGGQRMDSAGFSVEGLGGDVPTSQTGKNVHMQDFTVDANGMATKGSDAERITRLGQQRDANFRRADAAMPDAAPEGTSNLRPASDFADAMAHRERAKKNQTSIDGMISNGRSGATGEVTPSKLGHSDTGSFVRNLIENGARSDIDKLKKMVDTRDVKMHKFLDELGALKSQYDEAATKIKDNRQQMLDLADKDVPDGMALISGFRNGVQGKIAIPKEVADAYMGKTKAQQDYITGIMSSVNAFVKQNLTSNNPVFALVTNPIRDAKTFAYNAKDVKADPYSIGKALVGGFASRLKKDDAYKKWIASGGSSGFYADERTGERMAKDVARSVHGIDLNSPADLARAVGHVMAAPIRALHSSASVLEDAPRLAQFKASLANGKSEMEAAYNSRNVTVDFQQSGRVGQVLNAWVPFMNARLQGSIKNIEAVKRNPARAAAVYATLTAAPILAAAANNELYHKDIMKMIPSDTRDNNFVIVYGNGMDKDGNPTDVIKIPKSDIDKVLGNPLEQFARFLAHDDPDTLAATITNMIGSASPIDFVKDGKADMSRALGSITPPIIKAPLEVVTNKNLYYGSDIVPQSLSGLPANEQSNEKTSNAAKFLAPIAGGGSPMKADNTLREFGVNTLVTDPRKTMSTKVSGASGSQMQSEFYKVLNKTSPNRESASKAINDAIGQGNYEEAQNIANTYNSYLVDQFTPFGDRYGQNMTQDLSDIYDKQKIVLSHRSVKQRQKAQLAKTGAQ